MIYKCMCVKYERFMKTMNITGLLDVSQQWTNQTMYDCRRHLTSTLSFCTTILFYSNITHRLIYISLMIRYSRACGSYQDFLDRGLLLTRKLLSQGLLFVKLKSSVRTCYGRHHDLVDRYGISVSQITTDIFHLS
jgi:hypothetical protein